MKCDVIASGIIAAYEEIGLTIPLVVRLEGTNVSQGLELLEKSGLPIITARGLGEVSTFCLCYLQGSGHKKSIVNMYMHAFCY